MVHVFGFWQYMHVKTKINTSCQMRCLSTVCIPYHNSVWLVSLHVTSCEYLINNRLLCFHSEERRKQTYRYSVWLQQERKKQNYRCYHSHSFNITFPEMEKLVNFKNFQLYLLNSVNTCIHTCIHFHCDNLLQLLNWNKYTFIL